MGVGGLSGMEENKKSASPKKNCAYGSLDCIVCIMGGMSLPVGGHCVWVCYLNERAVEWGVVIFWVGNLVGLGNCCKFVAQILITSMGYLHLYHHHHCCFLTESWVPVCGGM